MVYYINMFFMNPYKNKTYCYNEFTKHSYSTKKEKIIINDQYQLQFYESINSPTLN